MSVSRQEYQGSMYIGDAVPPTANKPFWVRLTANTNGLYSWKQVYLFNPPGTFTNSPGGLFGSNTFMPAFNPNGFIINRFPTFALIQKAYFDKTLNWVYVIVGIGASPAVPIRVQTPGTAGQLTAAFVESVADGNPPTFSDGPSCWALDFNGGVVAAGKYDGTFLLTHNDGKAVYGVSSVSTSAQNFDGAMVFQSVNASVSTTATLSFDTLVADTASFVVGPLPMTTFRYPLPGIYNISLSVSLQLNGTPPNPGDFVYIGLNPFTSGGGPTNIIDLTNFGGTTIITTMLHAQILITSSLPLGTTVNASILGTYAGGSFTFLGGSGQNFFSISRLPASI